LLRLNRRPWLPPLHVNFVDNTAYIHVAARNELNLLLGKRGLNIGAIRNVRLYIHKTDDLDNLKAVIAYFDKDASPHPEHLESALTAKGLRFLCIQPQHLPRGKYRDYFFILFASPEDKQAALSFRIPQIHGVGLARFHSVVRYKGGKLCLPDRPRRVHQVSTPDAKMEEPVP